MFGFLKNLNNAAQGKPLVFDDPNQLKDDESHGQVLMQNGQIQMQQNPGQNALTPQTLNTPAVAQTPVQPASQQAQPLINKADSRTFPVVYVRKTSVYTVNGQMEVECHLVNSHPEELDVESVKLLGREAVLRYRMKPGEDKVFLVYKGPTMRNTQNDLLTIDYKTHMGDFFESVHDIRFSVAPDKTYVIADIKLHLPIRDIHG